MLTSEFINKQVEQIDKMLLETRQSIERGMAIEESLLAQRDRWLGKVGTAPFLIGLPSLYVPEQRDGGGAA